MLIIGVSGCNMRCTFCNAMPASQRADLGGPLDPAAVARVAAGAAPALRSFTVLGGEATIHLDVSLKIAAQAPPGIPFVWKTNAYASPEALALLDGVPDVVLADFKFGCDACAERLAGVPRYGEVVRANIRWAATQQRLVLRHLLMPGHVECCFEPVARWLGAELPGAELSLMGGYLPAHQAAGDPVLGRTITPHEALCARDLARRLGLRLVPWHIAPSAPDAAIPPPRDEIWIDRHGCVRAHGASAALADCLRLLNNELGAGA